MMDLSKLRRLYLEHEKVEKEFLAEMEKAVRNNVTFDAIGKVVERSEGAVRMRAKREGWYVPSRYGDRRVFKS